MERRKTKYAIRDRIKEFLERIRQGKELARESHPGLDLDKDQPLPMEDALEERIKENAYKNADSVACQEDYESGEIQESSDSDEEKEPEEEIPEEPESPKGDGS
ncbi:Oidioi.mRNA.OKI2018_I69.PAR.g13033.t1.cds [Oikopleura dioica]|uniref:Oidioi.mRNA.OKI2018_I69.PAR.g12368.t1.cds n=1 Tax=Oikopleura dioica TaxID=34765 RepID=A0ABN7S3G1_OIKDI|nr:Oidioi.mRNA.OKI2018_I69.PAR.g12368.t1.cds [Oikopleura dioica]CAG5091406.1 Oidioi.mRNA.OKI2018_I69.PAR.g13033.t1.cds [Oikopleura dioica]